MFEFSLFLYTNQFLSLIGPTMKKFKLFFIDNLNIYYVVYPIFLLYDFFGISSITSVVQMVLLDTHFHCVIYYLPYFIDDKICYMAGLFTIMQSKELKGFLYNILICCLILYNYLYIYQMV